MTKEEMEIDLVEKYKTIGQFQRKISGKTFTIADRNELAKVVMFLSSFTAVEKWVLKIRTLKRDTTDEEDSEIYSAAVNAVKIIEMTDDDLASFWRGDLRYNPKKIEFMNKNAKGGYDKVFLDMEKDVKSITVPLFDFGN